MNLHVRGGACLALIGRNGSGKSTLVQHLNGLLRPTAGRVLLDGSATRGRSVAQLAATVGLAFQDPDRQIFASRVRSEVEFGPRNLGMRGARLAAAVDGALDAVGLRDAVSSNPYDLLLSERKLLAIASVLAMETDVVVLDEPTAGQDERGRRRVIEIVERLTRAGRTVLAISHDMEFVAGSFERVVVMHSGRVTLDGAPGDVFGSSSWDALRESGLEPPIAARVGHELGLGATPTDASLVRALVEREASARQ